MSAAAWSYKAVDGAGVPSKGTINGSSKQDVTDQLREQGLKVIQLAEKKSGMSMEITLVKRVKAAELTVMTRQLAAMISSGMTLLRAFYVLEDQIENKLLKETVGAVREDIESGPAFSAALAKHPHIFTPPSPGGSRNPPRSSTRSTSRWSARARPAACSRRRWSGSRTSSRRTTRCAA